MSELSKRLNASSFYQRFSLPEDTIVHIAMNPPSPEVFHKLIKCCKYFWLKNRVITLNGLYRFRNDEYCMTDKINGFEKIQKFKIENVNKKLWIYRNVYVLGRQNGLMASSIIPRIYRCDVSKLTLEFQSISFEEFRKLTSSGSFKSLYFFATIVKNDDGTIVPIEKLIEFLPKLQKLIYENVHGQDGLQTITSETAAKVVALPHFPKMKRFDIYRIPESFDIEAFFATPKVWIFSNV